MPDYLVVRADGNARMGTGHVMRSLALAQGWQRIGGRVLFTQADSTEALEQRICEEGMEFKRLEVAPASGEDAAQTVELARANGAQWVAGDSYKFDASWQRRIKEAGLRLLLWDDTGHADHYEADLILNQNLTARAAFYARRAAHTRLLLGTRYAHLRREFLEWRDWQREIPTAGRKILVTLGGSDPDNATAKVVEALKRLSGIEAKVIIGGSNPHRAAVEAAASGKPFIQLAVNPGNMPELMAWADVAISGGGSTCWELAWMGLPAIVLVLAENQAEVAPALAREGLAHDLGLTRQCSVEKISTTISNLLGDEALRIRMSQRGREVIDGYGVDRVVTRLRAATLPLRRAIESDSELIWKWANDAKTRAASFSSDPIPWDDHRRWYAGKLATPDCCFFVGLDEGGQPLGQVRFEVSSQEATISVSLAPEARGKGLAALLIARAVDECFAASPATAVHAYIKPDNAASIRAFERADFTKTAGASIHGQAALHYVVKRESQ